MSFRVAISGLKAAQSDLNVIANNVANTGTSGFKKSRAQFSDVFAVTDLGAGSNTPGSGVRLATISQQFSQGNITFTDNSLDMAISGRGFFVLDDNGSRIYTRAGAFGIDRDGYISNPEGKQLIAFDADAQGNITGQANPLQVDTSNITPQATSKLELSLNLNASDTPPPVAVFDPTNPASYNDATSGTIYDSLGNSHLLSNYFVKTVTANTWDTYSVVDGVQVSGPDTVAFDAQGALITPAGGSVAIPPFTASGGGNAINMTLDFSNSTQYGAPFSVFSLSQDGFSTGRLSGLEIDKDGIIFARFTNGQSRVEGQIALADFPNPQGLQPLSDSTWGDTYASGAATIGVPGTSSLGLVQSGALEDSNVEISEELVKMIIAQRAYQANAQVISTNDTIMQSIINLR